MMIDFEIKDLNVHNVLASIAALNALGLNIFKIKKRFKNFELSEGRGKKHLVKRYKKVLGLLMKVIMPIHYL